MKRFLSTAVAVIAATWLVVACGENDSTVCFVEGATKAEDCNSCTCTNGGWQCTDKACAPLQRDMKPGGACTDDGGKQHFGAEGCVNTAISVCTCAGGVWQCSSQPCMPPSTVADAGSTPVSGCTPGSSRPAGDGCNTCTCSDRREWMCTLIECEPAPTPACADGATKKIGCHDCVCSSGTWACDDAVCPTPQCTPGETKSDGCNGCACTTDGIWTCTANWCPEEDGGSGHGMKPCGGRLGNTCENGEYCGYSLGEFCGQADATSHCIERSVGCPEDYFPVCGCDMKTYANGCKASEAGTGLFSDGPCKPTP